MDKETALKNLENCLQHENRLRGKAHPLYQHVLESIVDATGEANESGATKEEISKLYETYFYN